MSFCYVLLLEKELNLDPFNLKLFNTMSGLLFNPFFPNAPFLSPLKTSENLTVPSPFYLFTGFNNRLFTVSFFGLDLT